MMSLLLLLATTAVQAAGWDGVVVQAFELMEDDLSDGYAYTETRSNGDGVRIARYDPRVGEGEPWRLESVDSRAPSDDEIEEFLEQKEAIRKSKLDNDEGGIASIVADGSLRLIDETDVHWLFGFRPAGDSDEDKAFMESVDGTLMIVKEGHYVSEIALQNSEAIKPGKGIKIKEFRTTMSFAPVRSGGRTVPSKIESFVKGKAMFVIKIDESETVEYTDFATIPE